MVLVLLLAICIIVFCLSTVKIKINKLEISNQTSDTPIIKEIELSFGIYAFNKIMIFNKTIDKAKIQNAKNLKSIDKFKRKLLKKNKIENNKQNIKFDIDIIKQLKLELQSIDLKLQLGTEDVILTCIIICIIAIAISIALSKVIKKYDENKYKYIITPVYNNKNSIKIVLNGILNIKLVNIIKVIFRLLYGSGVKNEQSSNRRTYDNCNEQYSRNDRCKYNYRGTN